MADKARISSPDGRGNHGKGGWCGGPELERTAGDRFAESNKTSAPNLPRTYFVNTVKWIVAK